jgi:hypothetical protein
MCGEQYLIPVGEPKEITQKLHEDTIRERFEQGGAFIFPPHSHIKNPYMGRTLGAVELVGLELSEEPK